MTACESTQLRAHSGDHYASSLTLPQLTRDRLLARPVPRQCWVAAAEANLPCCSPAMGESPSL